MVSGAEARAAEIVAAAGYGEEGGAGKRGEKRGPEREFVSVVGDYEGAWGEDAVLYGD